MTENESDLFSSAQIGEPVPGEDAFDRDDDLFPIRCNRLEKGIGFGLHVAMKYDRASLVEDTEVHGSSVQINSAVMRMLLRIESHRASSFLSPFGDDSHIGMVGFYQACLGEASISITAMEPTIGAPRFRRI